MLRVPQFQLIANGRIIIIGRSEEVLIVQNALVMAREKYEKCKRALQAYDAKFPDEAGRGSGTFSLVI